MTTDQPVVCETCGTFGDLPHEWSEGTCVLPHNYLKPPGQHPPQASVGRVCGHCLDRWREALQEVTDLYATLPEVVELGSVDVGEDGEKRSSTRTGSPAPFRLEAWAMLNDSRRLYPKNSNYEHTDTPDVPMVLTSWVECLDEFLRFANRADHSVAGMCNALAAHAEDIAASPWVDEFDAEVRWLGIALRRAHGIPNPRPIGDCLGSERGTDCTGHVWRDPDGDQPRCDRCGRRYGVDSLVRLKLHEGLAS